jgi:hypothetical protein
MPGRKKIRTERVLKQTQVSIRNLFGTIKNAYARLNMKNRGVQYNAFYRALNNLDVTEHVATQTANAWNEWKNNFLAHADMDEFTNE